MPSSHPKNLDDWVWKCCTRENFCGTFLGNYGRKCCWSFDYRVWELLQEKSTGKFRQNLSLGNPPKYPLQNPLKRQIIGENLAGPLITVETKIIADPEKYIQQKLLFFVRDRPCLELIIISSNFQAVLLLGEKYWNHSESSNTSKKVLKITGPALSRINSVVISARTVQGLGAFSRKSTGAFRQNLSLAKSTEICAAKSTETSAALSVRNSP